MDTLGKRVAFARKRLNLTQIELAALVGLGQSSIAILESGRTKKTRHLHALAGALKVPADWLSDGQGSPTSQTLNTTKNPNPDPAKSYSHASDSSALSSTGARLETLAARLVFARERKQMTQEQLSKKSGLSQSTIGNLETGRNKGTKRIVQLGHALDITPEWLLEGGDYRFASQQSLRRLLGVKTQSEESAAAFTSMIASAQIHPLVESSEAFPTRIPVAKDISRMKIPLLSWMDPLLSTPFEAHASTAVERRLICPFPHSAESFYLRIFSDSMSPDYRENELVIIDPHSEPTIKKDVVMIDDKGDPTFGRITEGFSGRYLTMLNADYPDRVQPITATMIMVGTVIGSIMPRG